MLLASNPPAYSTDFHDRAAVLREWRPQEECAHCDAKTRDQCTNMTLSATTFDRGGMTHTTRALPSSTRTACSTERQVCSSGHMTWRPELLYGNFTIVARFFPGAADEVNTSTAFIGLDSSSNSASITMGFHGAGWLKGDGTGPHSYQLGVYAHKNYTRPHVPRVNTTEDLSNTFNTYGMLWTPTLVEWRLNGRVVSRYTNATHIPFQKMQLRLHTRSGYCGQMRVGATFNATFRSFSYESLPDSLRAAAPAVSIRNVGTASLSQARRDLGAVVTGGAFVFGGGCSDTKAPPPPSAPR
jgi:hypothetical protein